MKYVHCVEAFSTGILSWLSDVISGQVKAGHRVTVIHSLRPETPANFSTLFPDEVDFVYLPMQREVCLGDDFRSIRSLLSILRSIQPDVVHLHSSKAGAIGRMALFMMPAASRPAGVYSPHGLASGRSDISLFHRWLYKIFEGVLGLLPAKVLACSGSEFRALERWVSKRKLLRLDNAVHCPEAPSGSDLEEVEIRDSSSTRVTVCSLGGVRYQKAPWVFAEVASALGGEIEGVEVEWLWIGGADGDNDPYVEGLLQAGVELTGWLPRSRALKMLESCDIYLQTSLWEGLSIAVLEAGCMGLPAVVSDCEGNRGPVLEGETGYVAGNLGTMIDRVKALILDGGLRERMGQRAHQWVGCEFSMEHFLCGLDEVYRGALQDGAGYHRGEVL
ncbi:MAG: glycosyltransferase [bacterium]